MSEPNVGEIKKRCESLSKNADKLSHQHAVLMLKQLVRRDIPFLLDSLSQRGTTP